MHTTSSNVSDELSINPLAQRITINHIFAHNHNWDVFYQYKHRDELRSVEIDEVETMLSCGEKGYRLFQCPN